MGYGKKMSKEFGYDDGKLLLPKSRSEIEKWCWHYYQTDPLVSRFFDHIFEPTGLPPTREEVARVLTPYLMSLVYQEQLKQAKMDIMID